MRFTNQTMRQCFRIFLSAGQTIGVTPERALRAFSLVELLVVIAVIAILAGFAIPNILYVTTAARTTKDQRNARMIASLAAAARGAGYSGAWDSKANAITILSDGILITNANNSNVMVFRIDTMPASDQSSAADYLTLSGSNLSYVPTGEQHN